MATAPRVSVYMPAYNAAAYVRESVESILGQTYRDFEFIVVDDGSTDDTLAILETCARRDPRLRVVAQPHTGLPGPLNTALNLARGEFLARMDADDLAHPALLQTLVDFLDQHPAVGLCGAWQAMATEGGPVRLLRHPTTDAAIRCGQLFRITLPGAPSIFRAALLRVAGGYDPTFHAAEDYELWVRLAEHTQLAVVPAVLYRYRQHAAQKTLADHAAGRQWVETLRIQSRLLNQLGLNPDEAALRLHVTIGFRRFEQTPAFVDSVAHWLATLQAANDDVGRYDRAELARLLAEHWYLACRAAARQGWWAVRRYWQSPLSRVRPLSLVQWYWFVRRATLHTLRIPPRRPLPAR